MVKICLGLLKINRQRINNRSEPVFKDMQLPESAHFL